MSLVELLVAMVLTAILLLGLVQLVIAAGSATLLQDNQAQLEDSTRQAEAQLRRAVGQAGYRPEPWNTVFDGMAVAPGTADGVSAHSDRLVVRGWSDLNCFDNRNPDMDAEGKPRFYIRESTFEMNGSAHLTRSCRYGPSDAGMISQVRRQGLVPGVESFQLLFGEDSDSDGSVDRWVRAGQWSEESHVLGIRVALLLAGPDRVMDPLEQRFEVLDAYRNRGTDGRLRNVLELSMAIRGRSG